MTENTKIAPALPDTLLDTPFGSPESRAAARALLQDGGGGPPATDPVFVSKEAVLEGRTDDVYRAVYQAREFVRGSDETAQQFRERVEGELPVQRGGIFWFVK